MSLRARAILLRQVGGDLSDGEVELPDPGPGQLRVRIAAAGVCHSDLSLANGSLAQPLPAVLGHEASGVIESVGPDVTGLEIGQRVVLNWSPACGRCWFCARGEPYLCERAGEAGAAPYAMTGGEPVHAALGTGAFAQATVVPAAGVVPLPDGVDLADAAVLGCAMLTGVGAVLETAHVAAGDTVAVLGLGGVGLAAVQGARLAGAAQIVAIDVSAEKEPLALACGATRFAKAEDARDVVKEITDGRGVDHAFECVGHSTTVRACWGLARRGGQVTVVGVGRRDDAVSFSALELFYFARTLRGCVYGSSDPARDLPRLSEWLVSGELSVAALVTHRVAASAEAVTEAFDRMRQGHGGRTIVSFPDS